MFNNVLVQFTEVFNVDDLNNGDSVEEEEQDEDSYENRLARLRKKHEKTIADFKFKCWAKCW